MTKKGCLMVLMVSFLFLLSTFSDAAFAGDNSKGGIRGIDFLNHTYCPTLCQREFGKDGIGRKITVKNGHFENKDTYYDIDKKIIYGDLNNDGNEEAVIWASCGLTFANYYINEVYIYTIKNGHELLLCTLDDVGIDRDYKKYYNSSDTIYMFGIHNLEISKNKLIIKIFSEGPHCCPKHETTLEYKWNGSSLVISKKPVRNKVTK